MKTTNELFAERTAVYESLTDAILDSMSGVLDGIRLYTVEENLLTDDTELEFITASLDTENNYVFLVGMFTPNIGTKIMLQSGEEILIENKDDQNSYGKMLRINISPETIVANDPVVTLDYIRAANARLQEELEKLQDSGDFEVAFEDTSLSSLTEEDKEDGEKLKRILEGATNPSGLFN